MNQTRQPAIETIRNADRTYTVLYFGKPCGHIARGKRQYDDLGPWITVSNHNDVARHGSFASARSHLIGSAF